MADPGRVGRLRSGQWLGVTAGVLALAALAGLALSLLALQRVSAARRAVVDVIDPALVAAGTLETAMLDEETGVRGYALTREAAFLSPYRDGLARELAARAALEGAARTGDVPGLGDALRDGAVVAGRWQAGYARPVIAAVRAGRRPPSAAAGKVLFDRTRVRLARVRATLRSARSHQRARLAAAARQARIAVVIAALLLIAAALAVAVTLRRVVTVPLGHLADDARRVARGDFDHRVRAQGARDVVELGTDVDAMRHRVLAELAAVERARAALEAQARELQRSNADLEQFAYVASHDLQEPLRRIAGFVGMLRHHYEGRLDERADQYIRHAVDGAERLQRLISELLEFSRVGHGDTPPADVALDDALRDALQGLDVDASGATVEAEPLPVVRGDAALLTALWQNLVGNAIKFSGDAPPHVRVAVRREDGRYRFTVDDNGIGIDPRHAERVFAIFQRLHGAEDYAGTGIGLALCRRIVEHHGGEIWVEPEGALGGASFAFTLPVPAAGTTLAGAGPDSSDG